MRLSVRSIVRIHMPAVPFLPADICVDAVAFSPIGDRLAASAGRLVVIARAAEKRTIEIPIESADDLAYCLAFSPRGDRLAVVFKTAGVFVLDAETGAIVTRIAARFGHSSVVWSPDARYLVAGQYEPFLTIFDLAAAQERYVLDPDLFDDEGHTSVTFVDDTLLSTAGSKICLWPFSRIVGGEVRIKDLANTLGMVPAVKAKKIGRSGTSGNRHVVDLAVSPDRTQVVALETGEDDGHLVHMSLPDGASVCRAIKLPRFARHVVWTAEPGVVAVSEPCDSGLVLWSLETRHQVPRVFDGAETVEVTSLAISPDRATIAAGTSRGLWQWNVVTGRNAVH